MIAGVILGVFFIFYGNWLRETAFGYGKREEAQDVWGWLLIILGAAIDTILLVDALVQWLA